jgi:hypothetical protein
MERRRLSGRAARPSVRTAFSIAGALACVAGHAAAHEPPFGTGVFSRDARLVVRTPRGLVVSSSPQRQEFRLLCNEALGVAEYDTAPVLVRADGSLLVGTSTGLVRVSADMCEVTRVLVFEQVRVSALSPDPSDSTRVYAATSAGLFESRDAGETFTKLDEHAFESLEVPRGAPDVLFAAGSEQRMPGQNRAYFARWQRGQALELEELQLETNEFGAALLGSDAQRVFAVARAYLGTEYPDRLLVSADNGRSWRTALSTSGIAAAVSDAASGAWLIGSETGLWRTDDALAAPMQLRSEAISCLARGEQQQLYVCDGAGADGGVSEVREVGASWRSVLRWNQLTGLAACDARAVTVQLCEAAWVDWQNELPAGPPLQAADAGVPRDAAAEPASPDAAAAEPASPDAATDPVENLDAAPGAALENTLPQQRRGASCAAVGGTAPRHAPLSWLWLALLVVSTRLPAKRSSMTRTFRQVARATGLLLLLLGACGKDTDGSNAGSMRVDAGAAPDSSAPLAPNQLEDAAVDGSVGAAEGSTAASSDAGTRRDAGERDDAGRAPEPSGGAGSRAPANPGTSGQGGQPSAPRAGEAAPPTAADAGATPDTDSGPTPPQPQGLCTTCGDCEETIKVVSAMHTDMVVRYADPPPTSGPHNPCWTYWGVHEEPTRAERWVHNLEHGGVVFLYHCPEGCDEEIAKLKALIKNRWLTIVAEYTDLPTRFGVVSWGHRLISDCYDEQAFIKFYTNNVNHAPESNGNPPNPGCPL